MGKWNGGWKGKVIEWLDRIWQGCRLKDLFEKCRAWETEKEGIGEHSVKVTRVFPRMVVKDGRKCRDRAQ